MIARKPAKNMSTKYVSVFPTVPKMPVPSVDAGMRAMFWFRASLALFSVLSTLCPQEGKVSGGDPTTHNEN